MANVACFIGPFVSLNGERCTLALADAVMATNQSVLATVKQRGNKRDDEVFIARTAPNTLDTNAPVDVGLKKGKRFLVGYIGVMGNADGARYLIEAAQHIIHTRGRSDVQFLLIGSGPEHAELVRLRDSLGLANSIDMPGRVSNEFLFTALQTMDLGVACDPIKDYSDHCTMNKTLEYMAFSKAQVMFGTREGRFSAGDAALYVMENSAALLGDAILELLDDEPRRQQMGVLGHERLTTELSWSRSIEALRKAYARAGGWVR